MIDREHRLSLSRQARLLGMSRGSVYYQRRPASVADLVLMRRLDALHVDYPFAGSRMLRGLLRQEGSIVGRLHVAPLMKRMGIAALYRRPATSHPTPGHQIYPYLLRKLAVTRPNHVSLVREASIEELDKIIPSLISQTTRMQEMADDILKAFMEKEAEEERRRLDYELSDDPPSVRKEKKKRKQGDLGNIIHSLDMLKETLSQTDASVSFPVKETVLK